MTGLSPWSIKTIIFLFLCNNMYIYSYNNELHLAISIGCTLTMPYTLCLMSDDIIDVC